MGKVPESPADGAAVGFVGLGNMGRHMARRLAESGLSLIAYDVNPDAIEEARGHGMAIAASPRECADRAGIVLCSLPTPAVVREVFFGEDGLIHGTVVRTIVDLSTVGPALAAEAAAILAASGIALVDAPVSGGTSGALAGTLTIMAAGPAGALRKVEPILANIGRNVLHVGDTAGQAQMAKLVNNMLFATNLIGALEAMALGVKGGLDPRRLLEVINASSGRSYITEQRIGPAVLQRDDTVRFATGLLQKDVALGLASAAEAGARMWLNESAGRFLEMAVNEGFAPRDYAALMELFEGWNGVSVQSAPEKQEMA